MKLKQKNNRENQWNRNWFIEKINAIDRPLVIFTNKNWKKKQIIGNETKDITTDPTESKG
jgi:hypothetical protein